MSGIDWGILLAFLAVTLIIGLWSSRKSGENAEEFFLSSGHSSGKSTDKKTERTAPEGAPES